MKYNKEWRILIFLVILFIAINYTSLDSFVIKNLENREQIHIERVIDGDTVVSNGTSVRMLGINTPEKGEYLSDKAKIFLEDKALNKTLEIENKGKDLYNRDLGYLYEINSEKSINLEIVENGYANYYFPEGKDVYYDDFTNAWEGCIEKNINLCEKSTNICADCIELKQFEYGKDVILHNSCSFNCNMSEWSVKDEGRKKFVFKNFILKSYDEVKITNEDFKQEYVWTKTGDTLFLRDNENKLVLWKGY